MQMANKSKAKGTRAETSVVKFLKQRGYKVKRQPLSGNKDIGDIEFHISGRDRSIIEVKSGKQTHNPSRSQLEEWMRQAEVEAINAGCKNNWYLIVVRYRRQLKDADVYAYDDDAGMITHFWLDQFYDRSKNPVVIGEEDES